MSRSSKDAKGGAKRGAGGAGVNKPGKKPGKQPGKKPGTRSKPARPDTEQLSIVPAPRAAPERGDALDQEERDDLAEAIAAYLAPGPATRHEILDEIGGEEEDAPAVRDTRARVGLVLDDLVRTRGVEQAGNVYTLSAGDWAARPDAPEAAEPDAAEPDERAGEPAEAPSVCPVCDRPWTAHGAMEIGRCVAADGGSAGRACGVCSATWADHSTGAIAVCVKEAAVRVLGADRVAELLHQADHEDAAADDAGDVDQAEARSSTPTPAAAATVRHREAWMLRFVDATRPWFREIGAPLPERIRVTMSLTRGKRVVAVCYPSAASADATNEVLVRLDQAEAIDVADHLLHELVHAALDCEGAHGSRFERLARALGLEGPMRSTKLGAAARARCEGIIADLGPFPHARLDLANPKRSGPRRQKNRHVKCSCAAPLDDGSGPCGYAARTSRSWIERGGPPICPLHLVSMVVEGGEDDDDGGEQGGEDGAAGDGEAPDV